MMDYSEMSYEELRKVIEDKYGKKWDLDEVRKENKPLAVAYIKKLMEDMF